MLGLYRYLCTDAEVILMCLVLISVRFLLRGLALQRFNQMCLAAPVALALFIYTLYALDEPITFERIDVLIGDLVGVGGRDVAGTILLASAKYVLPMFLLVGLVFKEARPIAAPLVSLVAWALVFRLMGGTVVVSHHPLNFGEVTRIIGESIYAIVLLIVLIAGTAALLTSPALRRNRAAARDRDAALA